MANEYRISQGASEVLVTLPRVVDARVGQVTTQVLKGHVKAFPTGGHRFYRFRFVAVNGGDRLRLGGLRIYDPTAKDISLPCRWTGTPAMDLIENYNLNSNPDDGYDSFAPAPATLHMDFADAGTVIIGSYAITVRPTNRSLDPYEWYLEASDDDISWEEMDHQTGVLFTDGQTKSFVVAGTGSSPMRRRNFMSFAP